MIEFKVEDMSCGHCASVITKTVKELDAKATIDVDLASKTVRIESSEDRAVLAQALDEAGYPTA
ncbi:MAG: heavy-metal-associated domain-containing protein [Burkholderiaceae bacterium]|nr:heavy-metal-associated domain-containing protein [Rhodoferax sp.]MCB2027441.1 heavy-metal-associated domain-containing protein [Rhodoferax sp.]MCB2042085.1 heavy-metal-associated domain-containing protein [Rhodoferax sp.]MCP5261794.1 heavy-metal-associated domain-containing protein [Rhodoferax sp.]MCW5628579.1 heavy-metal-associated domain-containing protein [Rhodoferax sp.]